MKFAKGLTATLLNRIPDKSLLYPVYGLIVLLIYGWSIYKFLWTSPSWLKILTLGEIGIILAYTLTHALIESLLVLLGLILITVLLPKKWFQNDFIIRGGVSVLYGLIFFMMVALETPSLQELTSKYAIRGLIDFVFLHLVIGEVKLLRKFIHSLAERSTVFLYLTIPASILALVIVLSRQL